MDRVPFFRRVSVAPARDRLRLYTLTCEQPLWGDWPIRCTWGRIGSIRRSWLVPLGRNAGAGQALPAMPKKRVVSGH